MKRLEPFDVVMLVVLLAGLLVPEPGRRGLYHVTMRIGTITYLDYWTTNQPAVVDSREYYEIAVSNTIFRARAERAP